MSVEQIKKNCTEFVPFTKRLKANKRVERTHGPGHRGRAAGSGRRDAGSVHARLGEPRARGHRQVQETRDGGPLQPKRPRSLGGRR